MDRRLLVARWHVAACVLALLSFRPVMTFGESKGGREPTLDEVVSAMRAYAGRVAAVRIRWHEVVQIGRGDIVPPADAAEMGLKRRRARTGLPENVLRFECRSKLLLKGSWMRYWTKAPGKITDGPVGAYDSESGYDGDEDRWQSVVSAEKRRRGNITALSSDLHSALPRLKPLMLLFRPFADECETFRVGSLRLAKTDVVMNGRHCVLLDDGRMRAWVDVQRAFVPLVIEKYTESGETWLRATVEYSEHPQLYWAPSAYRVDIFGTSKPGVVTSYYHAEKIVVEAAPELQQKDFTVVFEPGTAVYDDRDGNLYVIDAEGRKRFERNINERNKSDGNHFQRDKGGK